MAILKLVDGKKGPGDILVLVSSYNEPMSIAELLYLNKCVLDSESAYYPISKGYSGKAYFLNAINELACGVPFERVLEKYCLKHKKGLKVVDQRKSILNENQREKMSNNSSKSLDEGELSTVEQYPPQ